ncbi:uncharacterized protein LOC132195386 [Neocloeon triangulifer]|uniref:uncharacterized protein LOC132195386 n=1 Tax=Neocloeon triangulifer TaxID=2078957 RepID=UPI00286ED186|nr:uncharacterized protein LOC132195386 [Neocloeon triangulifer]
MSRFIQFLKILLFILVLSLETTKTKSEDSSERDRDAESKKEITSQSKAKPCGPQMLTDPDSCCKVPRLIEKETLRSCVGGFGAGMGGGLSPKALQSFGKLQTSVRENVGGEAVKLAMEKGPLCASECILRSQGYINLNGDLDFEAIKEKLLKNSSDDWKKIVETAVENCSSELQGKRIYSTAASGNKENVCKADATVTMSCLRRYFILECPESAKGSNKDGTCEKNREFLAKCDPFTLTTEAIEGKFPDFIRQHIGNMMGLSNARPGQKRRRFGFIGQRGGSWELEPEKKLPAVMMG